ncbi:MAG: UDP-N-acetylglucosamine 1-carboxyvinyltransferase [Candidatus Aureabacteria bacterium]|nr:UDP-N-acetylglucosamine 1-carboxyvinyltransferase [Candidatus Auribacterota bacterium]
MDKFIIRGGARLKGSVKMSGSKNAALPIMAASILADSPCEILGVPDIRDIRTMSEILTSLGAEVNISGNTVKIDPSRINKFESPYTLVKKMRASIAVLGPLLGKFGKARVSFPGGCVIGSRPVDLHLKGLSEMGADIKIEHGYICADAGKLKGCEIFLGGYFGSSVLATANVMMAAVRSEGVTVIESAASEPEVVDLGNFLIKMGADINGLGSHKIIITGVKSLKGVSHEIIPDRIEAATFLIAGAICGDAITIENINPDHLKALSDAMRRAGISLSYSGGTVSVRSPERLFPVDIVTMPYPGFPTDVQAQMTALMCMTPGLSIITEKIYPERFMHVPELARMGARIHIEGASAIVKGVKKISGAPVMASDLRASAALVLAGLAAEGETSISRVYHIDRGYESIEKKLALLGADIERVEDKSGE